ncbi:hypothetical protein EVAR_10835_1 [Eumeta japonica]|uniref:Uncharacterized protein n=1 Tax=Eumeta variegata TaxID=151549 RepID=A0A4C1Y5X2_EUMVA|nr:hypothetical protein EVAR_10835_1 [Eumeta japonica]
MVASTQGWSSTLPPSDVSISAFIGRRSRREHTKLYHKVLDGARTLRVDNILRGVILYTGCSDLEWNWTLSFRIQFMKTSLQWGIKIFTLMEVWRFK